MSAAYPQLNRNQRKSLELKRMVGISSTAQTIKYADILDNSAEIAFQDAHFAPRYLKECLNILQLADKGNSDLRRKAIAVVRVGLASITHKV